MVENYSNNKQDDDKIVSIINKWYKKSKSVKLANEPTKNFKNYYNYYRKKQLPQIPNSSIPNSVTNMVFSIIETQLPIMTDNKPTITVFPESDSTLNEEQSEQNIKTAAILTKLIDRIWENNRMGVQVPISLKDGLITGTNFLSPNWNPELENGLGDIEITTISPLHVFPEENAKGIDDADYIIVALPYSVKKLKMEYPDKADKIEASSIEEDDIAQIDQSSDYQVVADTAGQNTFVERGIGSDDSDKTGRTMLIICWMRDDSVIEEEESYKDEKGNQLKRMIKKFKYPKGRYIKIAGNVKLDDRPNPYEEITYPLVKNVDYGISDSFWGIGEVEQIIDKQDIINNAYNKLSRLVNLCTSPVTILDSSTGIEPDQWVNKAGAVYMKEAGSPDPVWLIPPGSASMAPILEFIRLNKQDMNDIAGIHETSQGRRSTGVTSGDMVEALNEAVYTRMRLKVRNFEQSLVELGNMLIKLIQQFYTTERVITVIGADGNPEQIEINKAVAQPEMDQEGNPVLNDDGTVKIVEKILNDVTVGRFRVQVSAGSTLPKSKMSQMQLAQAFYQSGIFGDPNSSFAKGELLKYAEWKDRDIILKKLKEVEKAAQENVDPQGMLQQALLEKIKMNWDDLPTFVQDQILEMAGIQIPQEGTQKTTLPQDMPKLPPMDTLGAIPNA